MPKCIELNLSSVSLRSLEMFVAVEETGSITKAAARVGASRSAVSQQITNLEKMVGTAVFDRESRPIGLTPAGNVLRRHAHRILEAISEARADLMELSLPGLNELRIGIIDDLDASITPNLVQHLRERYPRCGIAATSGRSDHLNNDLIRREVDIVISGVGPDNLSGYEEHMILREPYVLVAPRGLFSPGKNLRQQMCSTPFIRYSPSMPIGRAIAQHLRRCRVELSAPVSFDASRSVLAMMMECNGCTITTPLCLLDGCQDVSQVDCFPLPLPGLNRSIRLVARRDELGYLPQRLAELSRELVARRLVPVVRRCFSAVSEGFVLLLKDDEYADSTLEINLSLASNESA
jgi:DNA-binding transcriptional LysR family regulator